MLEFYVSNLEAKQIQDTKDINDLVSENNELRRILALNSEGVEDCGYN